jgi:hypothetical protein
MSKEDFDAFVYSNGNNAILINGSTTASTGRDGKIAINGVHDNDSVMIFLKGVMPDDTIYVKSITVDEDNPNMRISWESVPDKGRNFDFEISIDSSALNSWSRIDDFSVFLYYKVGNPATIRRQTVLSDSSWSRIDAGFRRESDSRIAVFADFSRICKAAHINYLVVVDDENEGRFSMINTADEISIRPVLFKEE